MKRNITRILIYLAVIAVQMVVNDYINPGPFLYICILPMLVVMLPLDQHPAISMAISFAIGLVTDLLTDGVLGLNAGAATLLCAVRLPLFRLVFNADNYDKNEIPSLRLAGWRKFLKYMFPAALVYFAFYVGFDGFVYRSWLFNIARILLCAAVNAAIIALLSNILLGTDNRHSA